MISVIECVPSDLIDSMEERKQNLLFRVGEGGLDRLKTCIDV